MSYAGLIDTRTVPCPTCGGTLEWASQPCRCGGRKWARDELMPDVIAALNKVAAEPRLDGYAARRQLERRLAPS